MRTNGILLAVSSLPSSYGIGDFGESAFEFIDLLKEAKVKIWQILPLNPVGYGSSPYQSECSNAIDPLYISLDLLKKEKYLGKVEKFNEKATKVDYEAVRNFKDKYLREAFKNSKDLSSAAYKKFVKENPWLDGYTKFHCLFTSKNYLPWNQWDIKEIDDPYKHEVDYSEFEDEMEFLKWCQFIAFKQYFAVRKYANDLGIKIMGDIPFYVGGMSSDVWCNQDDFLLDANNDFSFISGVAPDGFSEDGQRWGNPLYDWEQQKKTNYSFWMERVKYQARLYDILRLDHFRAFDTYYSIPKSCPTAREGEWLIGPRFDFFDELFKQKFKIDIVAEDLGDLVPSVYELRDHYNLAGMYIFIFDFLNPERKILKNMIAYTGNHDNDTLKSVIELMDEETLKKFTEKLKEEKVAGRTLFDKCLNYLYGSVADYCIMPMQDILREGHECRMNAPSTIGSPNWEYKLKSFTEFKKHIEEIKGFNEKYNRI